MRTEQVGLPHHHLGLQGAKQQALLRVRIPDAQLVSQSEDGTGLHTSSVSWTPRCQDTILGARFDDKRKNSASMISYVNVEASAASWSLCALWEEFSFAKMRRVGSLCFLES